MEAGTYVLCLALGAHQGQIPLHDLEFHPVWIESQDEGFSSHEQVVLFSHGTYPY